MSASEKPDTVERAPLTLLLNRMRNGDQSAGNQAIELVYGELHRIAAREMRRERPGHTLQTTALIHEVYMRLVGSASLEIQSRGHFFAIASQQMRRLLVDYMRAAKAQRRGGGAERVDFENIHLAVSGKSLDLLLLDESLKELEKLEPRVAKVVELRYFGGYTDKEVVEALGVSLTTVRRDWEFARSWLFDRMGAARTQPARIK